MNDSRHPTADGHQLRGKTVLFAGDLDERGGKGIVRALLTTGAKVLVVSSDKAGLAALAHAAPDAAQNLMTFEADLASDGGAEAVRQQVEAFDGALDAVVANLGGRHEGPTLSDAGGKDLDALGRGLQAHMLLAKTFVPLLQRRRDSAYLLINDNAALDPKPASGITAAAAAGQLMLARCLSLETGGKPAVHSLVVTPTAPGFDTIDGENGWLTPANVGEAVVELVGHPDRGRGEVILTAGWRSHLDRAAGDESSITYI